MRIEIIVEGMNIVPLSIMWIPDDKENENIRCDIVALKTNKLCICKPFKICS